MKTVFDNLFLVCYDCRFTCLSFDLIYPIVCLRGVVTKSYRSFLITQLGNTIVCLLPRFSPDIKFRTKNACTRAFELLFPKTVSFYGFCVVILPWGVDFQN